MPQSPPDSLITLLTRLKLATPDDVARVERRARRLARGAPLFASVWLDALVQVGRLTPFQAAAINAQRGESLRIGPYVLFRKLPGLGFADVYEARHLETGAARRLAVFAVPADRAEETARLLERLVAASASLPRDGIAPVEAAGRDADRFWAACDAPVGLTAAEWMIHHGRLPGQAVLEMARRMMPGLIALERAALCHGDLRAATLLLGGDSRGQALGPWLPFPGLRAAVRPHEGYAHADLPPEAYDGLAPERVRDGTPPSTAGDVYACGCLWWHLLTGRDPLPGGDGLTQLQAAEKGAIPDPKPLAPDAPPELLAAIRACVQALPEKRPGNMTRSAALLGSPSEHASALRRALPRDFARASRGRPWATSSPWSAARRRTVWLAGVAVCVVAGVVATMLPSGGDNVSGTSGLSSSDTQATTRAATVRERGKGEGRRTKDEGRRAKDEERRGGRTAGPPLDSAPSPSGSAPLRSRLGSSNAQSSLLLGEGGLAVDSPVARLPLTAGQRVHGPAGSRITLNVAEQGLTVDVPGVIFENIDFVWPRPAGPRTAAAPPAMLVLRAASIELRGCTLRSADPTVDAIRWIHPAATTDAALSLPSGQATLEGCVFRGVAAAIDGRTRGAVALRFTNVLHLGAGPLIRLIRSPGADEPLVIKLERTTLRDSGPLVECGPAGAGPIGKISLETNGCVFSPRRNRPLLAMSGEPSPDAVLSQITWTGQGSLVTPDGAIVGRLDGSGNVQPLGETALSIEGLVRSQVEFAGAADGPATASQAVRWLAPLQSDEPPGIDFSSPAKEEGQRAYPRTNLGVPAP